MSTERSVPGGLAAVLAAGLLFVLGGPVGIAGGFALVAVWYALSSIHAFAVGQFAIVALAGDWPLSYTAGAELAVFAVLLASDVTTVRGRRLAAHTVVGTAALAGVAASVHAVWTETWATAVVVCTVLALVAYGLHRYERVATGAVMHEQ